MAYTAIVVLITNFLAGVLTAMVIYLLLFKFLDRPREAVPEDSAEVPSVNGRDGQGRQEQVAGEVMPEAR
jgi:hypothetical protein